MAINETMKKLTVPPRFVPYLERNRIYELFFELGTLLGVRKPEDQILFLRNVLLHMNETRDRPKLIFYAPPYIDKMKIIDPISTETGQVVISRKDFSNDEMDPNNLAVNLYKKIVENETLRKGWILHDYPSNPEEAAAMLQQGITPTHTIVLIPSTRAYSPKEIWVEDIDDWTTSQVTEFWNEYQRNILDLKNVFSLTLREVSVRCRRIPEILEVCLKTLKEPPQLAGNRVVPRVVIIGTRGSRRGQLARLLADKLRLVLVDMGEVMEQARLRNDDVGEQIRFLDRRRVPVYGSMVTQLLQERLLCEDCLAQGWVTIRFPRDRGDFEAFDSFDTPPNRVIFLAINGPECFERLREIRINKFTGKPDTISNIRSRNIFMEEKDYFIHPTDDEKRILLEQERFSSALQGMLDYCGDSCAIVNGRGDLGAVLERVEAVVTRPAPAAAPRAGSLRGLRTCAEDPTRYDSASDPGEQELSQEAGGAAGDGQDPGPQGSEERLAERHRSILERLRSLNIASQGTLDLLK